MNKTRRLSVVLSFVPVIVFFFSACCKYKGIETKDVPVQLITLNCDNLKLKVGEQFVLTAEIKPANATNQTIQWSSTADEIVSITSQGVVTALHVGSATAIADIQGVQASCSITVEESYFPVNEITLNESAASMNVGDRLSLVATISPPNASNQTVVWSSSDIEVATVDNGTILAILPGRVLISAKVEDKEAQCDITIIQPVSQLSLNKTAIEMIPGETEQLVATILPSNATDKTISWKSRNESVAHVDENGLVYAINHGSTYIDASAGGKTASCFVNIPFIPITSLKIQPEAVSISKGKSFQLELIITPANASKKAIDSIRWSSDDTMVASVDNNGLVRALSQGYVYIRAVAEGVSSSCGVIVTGADSSNEGYSEEEGEWKQ